MKMTAKSFDDKYSYPSFDRRFVVILGLILALAGYLILSAFASAQLPTSAKINKIVCLNGGESVCYDGKPGGILNLKGLVNVHVTLEGISQIESAVLYVAPKNYPIEKTAIVAPGVLNQNEVIFEKVNTANIPKVLSRCYKSDNGEYQLSFVATIKSITGPQRYILDSIKVSSDNLNFKLDPENIDQPEDCPRI